MAVWVIIKAYRHRLQISCAVGMMIAMAVAMMTSLLFGLIWGYLFQTMSVPTLLALFLGMIIGYTVGRPIHLMAALDGVLAGVMGGLMGPMLSIMVLNELPLRVIFFCTWAHVLIMLLVLYLIQQEKGKKVEPGKWILYTGIGLVSFMTLLIGESIDTGRSIIEVLIYWGEDLDPSGPHEHFHH